MSPYRLTLLEKFLSVVVQSIVSRLMLGLLVTGTCKSGYEYDCANKISFEHAESLRDNVSSAVLSKDCSYQSYHID